VPEPVSSSPRDKSFLFYDLETSGLNPAFDQVLTFAGIRTDARLHEIDRTCLAFRLRKDIILSPKAVVTHCLTPADLEDGLREYPGAGMLHQLFNTPDTCSLGYNSLGFDDEFLRFLFYRNLLDPYSHQYANGCFRADILPVAALFRVFCDSVIDWPVLDNGRPTLQLAQITRANRFDTSGPAHDAMADVEALVALSRRFSARADIWRYALGFFDKQTDLARAAAIPRACRIRDRAFRKAVMVSAAFGPDAGYLAPVLHIGASVPYQNQQLWIRLDRPESLAVDPDTGLFTWFPIRKKPADQWLLLPEHDRFTDRLPEASTGTAAAVLCAFEKDPDRFFDTIQAHLAYAYPFVPDLDPDAGLYQAGFFSPKEKKDIAGFHGAAPFENLDDDGMARLVASLETPRIKTLAARILMRSYGLPANLEFKRLLAGLENGEKITGYRSDEKYTLVRARADLADLETQKHTLDLRQQAALAQIRAYLGQWTA
jgi:exodeoxyribonuclease I